MHSNRERMPPVVPVVVAVELADDEAVLDCEVVAEVDWDVVALLDAVDVADDDGVVEAVELCVLVPVLVAVVDAELDAVLLTELEAVLVAEDVGLEERVVLALEVAVLVPVLVADEVALEVAVLVADDVTRHGLSLPSINSCSASFSVAANSLHALLATLAFCAIVQLASPALCPRGPTMSFSTLMSAQDPATNDSAVQ